MAISNKYTVSILYPNVECNYKTMTPTTSHDLGLDAITKIVTQDPKEQQQFMRILEKMTTSGDVARYRLDVFEDVLNLPDMRTRLLELMGQIDYLKDYGLWRKSSGDKPGLWDLLHRLDEIGSYITCVEQMRDCLGAAEIKSQGLKDLKKYMDDLYNDSCFAQMKKDISELKEVSKDVRSVTVGINVNERFEAESMGLISINSKPFKKSGILGNFADAIASKDNIKNDTDWDGEMRYEQVDSSEFGNIGEFIEKTGKGILMQSTLVDSNTRKGLAQSTMAQVPDGDGVGSSTAYLSNTAGRMIGLIVKKLRNTLASYTDISISTISKLIPELIYYIRFAEFIENARGKNMHFAKPVVSSDILMDAKGLYNLKLAATHDSGDDIVDNDLSFSDSKTIYILTGANRGGKTTLTQAVGLLFALAQGGIFVPCDNFTFTPVDMIYTHFPADEDKTMDLGRLGEECVRFKEIYEDSTDKSLILLNESFSTTSFEEGYYIAVDVIKAIADKCTRTIYNTHMHKIAEGIAKFNEGRTKGLASSIIMASGEGKRSFKVVEAPPEGDSYARDIARSYGVTYEMLTDGTK